MDTKKELIIRLKDELESKVYSWIKLDEDESSLDGFYSANELRLIADAMDEIKECK